MKINDKGVTSITLGGVGVSTIKDKDGNVLYSSKPIEIKDYFYIENVSNEVCDVTLTKTGSAPAISLEKSTNGVSWEIVDTTQSTIVTIPSNTKMYFKGINDRFGSSTAYNSITCSQQHNIGGNIMSLLYVDDFEDKETITNEYCFFRLFNEDINLLNTNDLRLPATTLVGHCYRQMFYGCTSLTTPPDLPATTLSNYCYYNMFGNCTSLTQVPELPATSLADSCYDSMFAWCKSLTTAPELPATTLVYSCYDSMFENCSSLTTAPELPATELADICYNSMFSGCTSLTTAPSILPATTLAYSCYNSMFSGCTSLTTAPSILPATTLEDYCYRGMFENCSSLTTAPELPATELVDGCYNDMFNGCYKLNYVKHNVTNWNTSYTTNWLFRVSSTGTMEYPVDSTIPIGTSGIPSGWKKKPVGIKDYFYIENVSNEVCDVTLTNTGSVAPDISLEKSYDGVSWETCTTTSGSVLASIPVGEKVYFRGVNDRFGRNGGNYNTITGSQQHNVGGNIMSLLYGEDFEDKETITNEYCFYNIFFKDVKLLNTNDLRLPATTLASNCYRFMFGNCTSLTTAPELPATTLTEGCYASMFNGCSSLTQTPTLPATTLASNCYNYMFYGCSSLTQAPELPVTTLANYCYEYMFGNCTSLTTAPELPATTLASYCYTSMFSGCTSLTTAPELPATTLASYCYSNMFYGCTSLTTPPELPATTLTGNCYWQMFNGCTSLTQAPYLPATTLVSNCYKYMFNSCSKLNYVRHNVTTWNTSYTTDWLYGVSSTGTMVCPADSTIPTNNESGIPTGWTKKSDVIYSYLYVENTEDTLASVYLKPAVSDATNKINIDVSKDGIVWSTISTTLSSNLLGTINKGEKLYIRGVNDYINFEDTPSKNWNISSDKYFNVGGNIMSLLYGSDFENNNTINQKHCFSGLFSNMKVKDAGNLVLPATTLPDSCYYGMFNGCSKLTNAPELPATTIGESVYREMFNGCSSLTKAPELPATTLKNYCYANMFAGCSSLTQAPALPATTLANSCYSHMFEGCSSLTQAPALPATTLESYCYSWMFRGCTSLTQAPDLPATTLTGNCYWQMFNGCTSLTQAPDLPATTLVSNCYSNMFNGCSNLNYVKHNIVDWNTSYTTNWLNGVSSTGKMVCPADSTIPTDNVSGIPSGWTKQEPITQEWSVETDGTYPFVLNSNGYYESTNKGKDSTYSYCTLRFVGYETLKLQCINYAETNYDFGIISNVDKSLAKSSSADSSNVFKSFKGSSSSSPVTVSITNDGGEHFITIKYIKDSSQSSNNDSFQFKVI